MEWFPGTVDQALSNYQEKNGLLVVYVRHPEGETSELTTLFNQLWTDFDTNVLKGYPTVFVRLEKDSAGAKQFSEFFPTPVIPVMYILGLNGQPLECLTATKDLSSERLQAIFEKSLYEDQLKQAGLKVDQSPVAEPPTKTAKTDETPASSAPGTDQDEKDYKDYPDKKDTTNMTFDEKQQYYRERLAWKKKIDAEKEKEEARQKELKRIADGKAMLEARDKQKDREIREAAEAQRRQKQDDAATLKRLREQIKADKEERARKAQASQQNAPQPEPAAPAAPVNTPIPTENCRIQCRFPNGSTLVKEFRSAEPLQNVVDAIKEDGRLPGQFFLVQTYPRKQLDDYSKSFLDHGLTPSAVLLVVQGTLPTDGSGGIVLAGGGYIQMLLGFLYMPLVTMFHFITTFVGGFFGGGRNTQPAPRSGSTRSDRPQAAQPRQGDVGRLRNDDSSDNEGTWNGNSTQQL
ncbi:UBX domain-containing protein [Aphelenchoides avenae]|nr:UBX domain-containing protein [Aphelenchus avenae]